MDLAKKIADIADVKLAAGDGLPEQVCRSCVLHVDRCHAFRQKCRDSDRDFRHFLDRSQDASSTICDQEDSNAATDSKTFVDITVEQSKPVQTVSELTTKTANNSNYDEKRVEPPPELPSRLGSSPHGELLEGATPLLRSTGAEAAGPTAHGAYLWQRSLFLTGAYARTPEHGRAHKERGRGRWRLSREEKCVRAARGKALALAASLEQGGAMPSGTSATGVGPGAEASGRRGRPTTGVGRRRPQCDVCGKVLSSEGSLKVHKANHTGARPFPCTMEGCAKRFSQYGNLQTHVRSHLGIRPYSCATCGAAFVQLANLQAHGRKHTSQNIV